MKIKPAHKAHEVLIKMEPGDEAMLAGPPPASAETGDLFGIKCVLVPVDLSATSHPTVSYAARFARHFGARLVLIHVFPPYYALDPNGIGAGMEWRQESLEVDKTALDQIAARDVPPGVPSECHVRCGSVISEIVAAAAEHHADLIILSTHGYTGLKRMANGSEAESVVRRAPCPVLTLRSGAES